MKTPDELEIDCQIARDILSDLFAKTAIAWSKENNPNKTKKLEKLLKVLQQKKMDLSPTNTKLIAEILEWKVN